MSNQEKETPRVKRLLKEGKLAYINKATLPSELTDSAQGDQLTIPSEVSYSKSKDTTLNAEIQTNEQKFSLITPEMDASYLDAVDPATIDYKHPFRVHKREVVQKYADHVADVLGLPTEAFAVDIDDDAQIRDAYYKYMRSHKDWATQHSVAPDYMSLKDFTEGLIAKSPRAAYAPKTTFIVLCISETDGYDDGYLWLSATLHENTHKIIEDLAISDFEKELVYKEAQKNNPKTTAKIDEVYHDRSIADRGEEIIAFAIEGRLKQGDVLLSCIEGKKDVKDVLDTYKNNVPLRKQILKKVINTLKDGYERKQNATGSKAGKTQNVGFGGNVAGGAGNTGSLRRRGYGAEVTRFMLPDPDPSDVFYDEIPIFDEQGNEIDITTLSSEEAQAILDSKVRQMLEARNGLKEKVVYIALLPLAKKNIELQKKQYGSEKENTIVIPRKDSSGRGNSKSEGGSSPSYSKGFSGTQARSAAYDRRSEGTDAQEVGYRHSIEEIIATPSQLRGSVVYIEYSGYRLHSW